jgi:tape measure domain-containing protein
MSNVFDYGVDFDADDALEKTKKMETGLVRVEDHAKKTGKALEDGFNKGAAAAKNTAGQIEASGVSLKDYEAALTRIHTPYDKLEKDMRVLDALQQTGAISAKQYADELARIGKEHGLTGTQKGMGAVSLPAPPELKSGTSEFLDSAAGKLTAIAGPAAIAAMAWQGLNEELANFKARAADTREATNTILKFYDSIDGAKAAMGEQKQIAADLGMNVAKTSHAYAAVREATEDYGVASKEAADITRNLTAAIVVDGGAIGNVTGIMDKLQYASEAGIMTQRELKGIWKESPEVVHMFEKALGKTYPQLMKMAAEGKLTGANLEKMVHGLGQGTEAIDKFRQRELSVNEVMEENHVDIFKAVLLMADMKKKYEEIALTGPEAFEKGAAAASHQVVELTKLADKLQLIMTAAAVQGNFAANQSMIDNGLKVQAVLDGQGNRYQQFAAKVREFRRELERAGYTAEQANKAVSQLHGPDWVDYYLQQLDQIRQPERDWEGRRKALNKLFSDGTITLDQYSDAFGKAYAQSPQAIKYTKDMAAATALYKEEIEAVIQAQKTGVVSPAAVGLHGRFAAEAERDASLDAKTLGGGQTSFSKQADDAEREAQQLVQKYASTTTAAERYREALIDIETHGASLDEQTRARLLANAEMKYWDEGGAAARKAAEQFKKTNEVAVAAEGALKSGVSDFVSTMADAADGADVSWSKFFRNLAKNIATAILQAAALKALGSTGVGGGGPSGLLGAIGGLFGGAHATGGMYQAPATGGGADTVPVMFRMSPKERAYFVPEGQALPQQVAPMQMNSRTVIVNKHTDRMDDVVDAFDNTRGGDQVIYNFMHRNRRAVSSLRRR